MSAVMASGDIDKSVSQGVPPFVVATTAGQDLQIIDVAVSWSDLAASPAKVSITQEASLGWPKL